MAELNLYSGNPFLQALSPELLPLFIDDLQTTNTGVPVNSWWQQPQYNQGPITDPGYNTGGYPDISDDELLRLFGYTPDMFDASGNFLGGNGDLPWGNAGGGGGGGSAGAGGGTSTNSPTTPPTPRPGYDASAYMNMNRFAQRPTQPFWDVTNTDPNTEMGQNRLASYAFGHAMDQSLVDEMNRDQELASYLLGDMFGAPRGYGTLLAGNTGFVDPSVTGQGSEWNDILQEQLTRGGMASADELADLAPREYETTQIAGSPYAAFDFATPEFAFFDGNNEATGQRLRETYQQLGQGLESAVDRQRLGMDPNYLTDQLNMIGGSGDAFLDINDPSRLGLSNDFLSSFQFGQGDIDALKDQAARTVQARTQAGNDQLMREAVGRGNTSALALNRARQENNLFGDVSAADAMTDAAIKGKGVALDVAQGREGMRLGTEQDMANRGYSYLMDTMGRGLDSLRDSERLRLGSEQDIASRLQGNARDIAGMKFAAEDNIGNRNQQTQQYKINTLSDLLGRGEQSASDRATTLYGARSGAQQSALNTRFGQGMDAASALSSRFGNIYGQKKAEEQEGRQFLGNLYSDMRANNRAAAQQRIGSFGTMMNSATQNSAGRKDTATAWDRIMQGIGVAGNIAGSFFGG